MRATATCLAVIFVVVAAVAATLHLGRAEARGGATAPLRTHPTHPTPRTHPTHLAGPSAKEVSRQVKPAAAPRGEIGPRLSMGLAFGDDLPGMSAADLAAALDDAQALGGWVRLDVSWSDVQHDGPQVWDWSGLDRVLGAARARGLRVLGILAYTPAWARPAGCPSEKCRPASPAAFSAFVSAAVVRYAPLGVHAWEIWNEPNSADFWAVSPSADDYVTVLEGAVSAIRRVDPAATVLSGGLAVVPTGDRGISPEDFLREMCDLGANRLVDGVAYHPYTYPLLASDRPSTFATAWNRIRDTPESLRSILAAHGSAAMPIWITEYGAPTGGPGTASDGSPGSIGPTTTHVTEARQAEIAADSVSAAAADPGISALMWYGWRDLGESQETSENHYGLRRADGTPKPALAALRAAVAARR